MDKSIKQSNPKDALGVKKAPMSTVSMPVMFEIGCAMLEGGLKYGRHNYRAIGIRASVYYDALMRHIGAWWEGEDIDPESGLNHIVKALATLVVMRDAMLQDKMCDDRPPKSPAGWLKDLNKKAQKLIEQYPNPVPAYLATDTPVLPKEQIYDLLDKAKGVVPVHADNCLCWHCAHDPALPNVQPRIKEQSKVDDIPCHWCGAIGDEEHGCGGRS